MVRAFRLKPAIRVTSVMSLTLNLSSRGSAFLGGAAFFCASAPLQVKIGVCVVSCVCGWHGGLHALLRDARQGAGSGAVRPRYIYTQVCLRACPWRACQPAGKELRQAARLVYRCAAFCWR
jgi:hypothetical protein